MLHRQRRCCWRLCCARRRPKKDDDLDKLVHEAEQQNTRTVAEDRERDRRHVARATYGLLVWTILTSALLVAALVLLAQVARWGDNFALPSLPANLEEQERALAVLSRYVDEALDPNVDPCEDFYQYSCGRWLRETEIPEHAASWSRSFSIIGGQNAEALEEILREPWPMLSTLFRNCMAVDTLEHRGTGPLHGPLGAIAAIDSLDRTFDVLSTHMFLDGYEALFSFSVGLDDRNPDQNTVFLWQGGLGLPNKAYYLNSDQEAAERQRLYRDHLQRMLALLPEHHLKALRTPQAQLSAQNASLTEVELEQMALQIYEFEYHLATLSMSPEQTRDPFAVYHRYLKSELVETLSPALPWQRFFDGLGAHFSELVVGQPDFIRGLDTLLQQQHDASNQLSTLRQYLSWQLVRQAAPVLDSALRNETFRWQQILLGTAGQGTRTGQCTSQVESLLGDLLGRYFVARYFDEDSRQAAQELVSQVEQQFLENLDAVQWLRDPVVREEARNKLFHLQNKVGYPDHWMQLEEIYVEPDRYYENVRRIERFQVQRAVQRIAQPVDHNQWLMAVTEVNAYYEPTRNEIVFPAAILQLPFFSRHAPPWLNYGAIGAVIGHEITHGFDDQGRRYDASGRLRDWWTPATSDAFDQRAQCLVDLYNTYEVLPDLYENGRLTLGENLADLGGLHLAHGAFQAAQRNRSETQTRITEKLMHRYFPGLTEDQLFFVSYGQSWCTKARSPYLAWLTENNPHAFPEFRVQGAVSNLEAFHEAFHCPVGSAMHPERQCRVW